MIFFGENFQKRNWIYLMWFVCSNKMKSRLFIAVVILFFLFSCQKKETKSHTITIFEISTSYKENGEGYYFIKSYCYADLSRDSVFIQWNPSDERDVLFTGIGWHLFSNDSIISIGMNDIQKYPNGWIKKTTGEECFTKPFFCLVENYGKSGRYFFYTQCFLDKSILDMSRHLLYDLMSSSYILHDNLNLIDERALDIIIKEGNFLTPPPKQQYPQIFRENVRQQ